MNPSNLCTCCVYVYDSALAMRIPLDAFRPCPIGNQPDVKYADAAVVARILEEVSDAG